MNDANIASLSNGGAVIIPEDIEHTYLISAYIDGKLNLNLIEFQGNSHYCTVIFGETYINKCDYANVQRHGDLLKSLFMQKQQENRGEQL